MAETRDQSVRDVLDVDFTFMFCRLAHGNDTDVIGLLRVNDGNENAIEQAKSYNSLLAVSNAIVFIGKRDTIENLICIGKVEPVLLEVNVPVVARRKRCLAPISRRSRTSGYVPLQLIFRDVERPVKDSEDVDVSIVFYEVGDSVMPV